MAVLLHMQRVRVVLVVMLRCGVVTGLRLEPLVMVGGVAIDHAGGWSPLLGL